MLSMFGPMQYLLNVGSSFQRVVAQALVDSVKLLTRAKETTAALQDTLGEPAADGTLSHIVQGRALTCSATALAGIKTKKDEKGASKFTVQGLMISAGALSLECSAILCSCAMSSFIEACKQTAWQACRLSPLMFFWRVRYDETPTKVRVVNLKYPAAAPCLVLSLEFV